jgi:ubiquinone biosynthesis protein COQ9
VLHLQALALLTQPANAPAALKLLTQLLDSIWYAAGDTATDASWYTKRAALASIYLCTELYMLTDYSPGYADTWQQLERRIDDALCLGSAAQSAAALPQLLLQALARMQQGQQQQQQAWSTQEQAGSSGQSASSNSNGSSIAKSFVGAGPTNSSSS